MKSVTVTLTEDELAGWLGDVYADSTRFEKKTNAKVTMREFDCGCWATRGIGEKKWHARFASTCSIGSHCNPVQ